MGEFWIVCKWNNYYPWGGIDNIVLVTQNLQEALDVKVSWEESDSWKEDFCEIYSSKELPWS